MNVSCFQKIKFNNRFPLHCMTGLTPSNGCGYFAICRNFEEGERASFAFQTKSGDCRRASLVSFNTRLLCLKLVEQNLSGRARPTALYNLFHGGERYLRI